jgi:hypothetical protein
LARRKMPDAAFWLKKYFDWSPVVSKTADKEQSTATLGDSEMLSVQHSPANAIPEFDQRPDEDSHVSAAVRRQKTGDVFKNEPPRL